MKSYLGILAVLFAACSPPDGAHDGGEDLIRDSGVTEQQDGGESHAECTRLPSGVPDSVWPEKLSSSTAIEVIEIGLLGDKYGPNLAWIPENLLVVDSNGDQVDVDIQVLPPDAGYARFVEVTFPEESRGWHYVLLPIDPCIDPGWGWRWSDNFVFVEYLVRTSEPRIKEVMWTPMREGMEESAVRVEFSEPVDTEGSQPLHYIMEALDAEGTPIDCPKPEMDIDYHGDQLAMGCDPSRELAAVRVVNRPFSMYDGTPLIYPEVGETIELTNPVTDDPRAKFVWTAPWVTERAPPPFK